MIHVVIDLKAGIVRLETDRERYWRIWQRHLRHVASSCLLDILTACGSLLLAIGLWTKGGKI